MLKNMKKFLRHSSLLKKITSFSIFALLLSLRTDPPKDKEKRRGTTPIRGLLLVLLGRVCTERK